jgi:hypothetical protein
MNATGVSDALDTLATDDPSYADLVDLYNDLRTPVSRTAETTVANRALAQVLQEFIDYLDFVEAELEKSVGLSRGVERERLLDAMEAPRGETQVERVSQFIDQWESLERYTTADVSVVIEG